MNYGLCVECKVRNKVSSEKELHKCPYCERFFCVEHLEPKPVHIRDYSLYSKYPEFWVAIRSAIEVEGKHPCFQFTKVWVIAKDRELRLQKKLVTDWLDKSKAYRSRYRKVPKPKIERPKRTIIHSQPRKKPRELLKQIGSILKGVGGIVVVILIGVYLLGCFPLYNIIIEGIVIPINAEGMAVDLVELEIFNLINEERKAYGHLNLLEHASPLSRVAKQWSSYLAENNILEHGDFITRMASIGYNANRCGEIIAMVPLGSISFLQLIYPGVDEAFLARAFVDCWLTSPEHSVILTSAWFDQMGVGVSQNGGTFYGVVDFSSGF